MQEQYLFKDIEAVAQKHWEETQLYKASEDLSKEKLYCLAMFPYPSGYLHVGHVRNYTIADVIARYQRLKGKNVLLPMGWDAFGLPAENAAIKHKVAPAEWTYKNIDHMRVQCKQLGLAYDWSREIATCDPDYYKWEQWLFTRLFKKGLAYKKNSVVNWDPVDNTVLANEQVVDGRGWRSGALVERREIPQWFIKITDYADELLDGLDKLTGWPDQVKTMQCNWIGRSEGLQIRFKVTGHDDVLEVYTTRPDTLMGATYLAIAPQHPLALAASKKLPELAQFIEECRNIEVAEAVIATIEKRGVNTGFTAVHPITGEKLPVFAANFVVMDYGTGAVMSVPAHDQRDFEFAELYKLPIKPVIKSTEAWDYSKAAMTERGTLINSSQFDGLDYTQAFDAICKTLEKKQAGERKVNYRLRDWGVSRQRYWGTPIPIIYCDDCGAVPVPDKDLPVVLPEKIEFAGPQSPLKNMPEFYNAACPTCGKPSQRETDTFDTFVESSWYYARFASTGQKNSILDDRAKYWTPVDYYIGGIEHAVMHLLYARFFHKLLRDEGFLNSDEPFTNLLTQGMVLKDGTKMSKSKGNTIDPQTLIEQYGADTLRLFIIFTSPPEQSLEWSDAGVEGAHRYLKRVWQFCYQHQEAIRDINFAERTHVLWKEQPHALQMLRRDMMLIMQQANYDIERLQLNTVVSACMKLLNLLNDINTYNNGCKENEDQYASGVHLVHKGLSVLLRYLYPITPHLTEYLWAHLKFSGTIHKTHWPKVTADALVMESQELVMQVNGKLKGKIIVPTNSNEETVKAIALKQDSVIRILEGKTLKKFIFVPGKLVNLVIGD
jgi:leucyl-tRNA synthetase